MEKLIEKYKINPRMDEYLTLMAKQLILVDGGDWAFTKEDDKMMDEKFTEEEAIDGCFLFIKNEITDFYMDKAGRKKEYIQWQKENKMNGYE
jgi:predicted metalloprotease